MLTPLSEIQNDTDFDVVIVGAGMVGASAAIGFALSGKSVLLLEAFPLQDPLPEFTPSYDARSTALAWGSREIFEQLGVWAGIEQHACPIQTVHVSQKGRFGTTNMHAQELGHEALGYVVPNQWLGQRLLAGVYEHAISVCAQSRVSRVQPTETGYCLSVQSEAQTVSVSARLLVVADGNDSDTAALLGIHQKQDDYGQHALIANVTTELPNKGVAYERFTTDGPMALLPLTEYESALVWTHESDQIDATLQLNDADFCEALQNQFGDRMGRFTRCGERASYPLRLLQAQEQVRPGVVLLGNAAHSLHPVAGQGFNLALRDVAALLACVNQYDELNEALNQYYRRQLLDQKRTITGSDQLVKVFGQRSWLLGFARDLGLIGLNNVPFAKTAFAKTAMGLSGRKSPIRQA